MELEEEPLILEDKWPEQVSIIEKPIDEHIKGVVQDALMSYYDDIHDDGAPCIKESFACTSIWSGMFLPLVNDDDPPLKKLSEPPKPTLKPFPSELRYTFLRDDET